MSIWNYLLIGICGVFRPSGNDLFTASEREIHSFGEGIKRSDWLEKELEKYSKQSDAERIGSDFRAIGGDMRRAMQRLEEMAPIRAKAKNK